MPSCLFVALPLLLWSSLVLAASPVAKDGVEGTLRMEVGAEDAGSRPIHIGPGVSTTLLFDTDIQQDQVILESRALFARVSTGNSVLVLVPSNDLQQGGTLKLSIPFKDASAAFPSRLSLTLVVDSGAVDRQVEVYRRARSAESYRQEVQQLRAELERLRRERVSPAEGARETPGFGALLPMSSGFPGVKMQQFGNPFICMRSCSLLIEKISTYTSGPRWAVKLLLKASDKKPWTIGRAVLVDRKGKEWPSLPPVQSGPITAESSAIVALEFDVKNPELGKYRLNVVDVDGTRTAQWSDIEFP
ncbi:DUF2381 family protein [Corallococcus exiguus]|uniref:DUF2381 family protein n=1 Tax=Corallococcus TaxID=83461 RepID=UPI000EA06643|nr:MULTISPECIES: DUF2381 family protein [unclassified Corallococcus]NNC17475.1 DUF2381 family protein [Corallococcus exiguus]RKH21269.1 DUF2381 family protein [Corallococcus sp. CA041A]RKI07858.1 DUF2381 family protein [Corallococcus sp. AB030]RUO90580.1 DUF2381 family protein [Corallococcus sp. AB018]